MKARSTIKLTQAQLELAVREFIEKRSGYVCKGIHIKVAEELGLASALAFRL